LAIGLWYYNLSDFKEIGCKNAKRLIGTYFAAFSCNGITIGPHNTQNLPFTVHFFAAIFRAWQAHSPSRVANSAPAIQLLLSGRTVETLKKAAEALSVN
jgi:hypothetical protein